MREEIPVTNQSLRGRGSCAARIDRQPLHLLYFDDNELPLSDYGLAIAAHLYNTSIRDMGKPDVVLTGKNLCRTTWAC